ncbi:hypothetical protein RRG08_039652 [Elysia crispata]|uniref:arginine--tRNA ligase n=1 Tax=Elysia crispata TaxID=231223 RepID=A0AAE0Y9V2_9GAST|nr:hypothetical protein RRG08_039652 [Elysia crispata]
MASEEQSKDFTHKAEKAEKEIEQLQAEINLLSDPTQLQKDGLASPELEKLRVENQKLKFQLKHLKKNVAEEQQRGRDFALDVRGIIEDIFGLAIYAAFPEVPNPTILVMPSSKFADYQCNSAMSIAQQLGTITGQKKNPREVAQAIVKELPETEFFEKIEIAGPGFINITLKKEFVLREIGFLLTQGVKPPKMDKKRIVIDYSSPNIAKEMHVGHLRSTIIGESLSRLLEWVGHDVLRLNHLGDWGTQFGMLIAHLIDKFPNLLEERPNIGDLQEFYRESKVRFDNDEVFKRRAYECVVKLQAKDPFYYNAWKIIYDISMKETYTLYKRLKVSEKLIERGESFYQERMVSLVKDLQDSGCTVLDEEGRCVMYVEGFTVPLMIVKSDGGFTYDTSDLACIKQRLQEEKGDWIIYVVDAGQSTHLETVFKAAAQLGWVDKSKHRIDHVAFGLVLGEDNFSLRSYLTFEGQILCPGGFLLGLKTAASGKRVLIERDGQDADVPTLDKRPLREVDESISDKLDVAASDSQTLNAGSLTPSSLCVFLTLPYQPALLLSPGSVSVVVSPATACLVVSPGTASSNRV